MRTRRAGPTSVGSCLLIGGRMMRRQRMRRMILAHLLREREGAFA